MTDKLKVSFAIRAPNSGPLASPQSMLQVAQEAEALGFDSVWVHDHLTWSAEIHRTHISYRSPHSMCCAMADSTSVSARRKRFAAKSKPTATPACRTLRSNSFIRLWNATPKCCNCLRGKFCRRFARLIFFSVLRLHQPTDSLVAPREE